MKITFYGHSCFLVEAAGKTVIIDPFLTHNPLAPVKPADVKVDAVLITHGHGDHVGDAVEIAKNNDCLIVANHEIATYLEQLGVTTHGMSTGGAFQFEFGRVKMTLALHGTGFDDGKGGVLNGGLPAGLLVTMGGKTFYHAGDTGLFGDMKLIGELNHIDVAALPIGDNYTMGPEDALLAASWIRAGITVPMHYSTFPLLQQDGEQWVADLAQQHDLRGRELQPGESLQV